jgi:hypothetical protein
MVIRMGLEPRFALKILDSLELTDDPRFQSGYDETCEVGDVVNFHALLMNPEQAVQYLCTAAGTAVSTPPLPPAALKPAAVHLYNTLVASYCADAGELAALDLAGVLVPRYEDGVGFADIADENGGLAAAAGGGDGYDDLAADETDIAEEGGGGGEITASAGLGSGFKKIKLAGFALHK